LKSSSRVLLVFAEPAPADLLWAAAPHTPALRVLKSNLKRSFQGCIPGFISSPPLDPFSLSSPRWFSRSFQARLFRPTNDWRFSHNLMLCGPHLPYDFPVLLSIWGPPAGSSLPYSFTRFFAWGRYSSLIVWTQRFSPPPPPNPNIAVALGLVRPSVTVLSFAQKVMGCRFFFTSPVFFRPDFNLLWTTVCVLHRSILESSVPLAAFLFPNGLVF